MKGLFRKPSANITLKGETESIPLKNRIGKYASNCTSCYIQREVGSHIICGRETHTHPGRDRDRDKERQRKMEKKTMAKDWKGKKKK